MMKKFILLSAILLSVYIAKSQDEPKTQEEKQPFSLEVRPSLSTIIGPSFYIGPKVDICLKRNNLSFGIFGEYFKSRSTSIEVGVYESLTKIKITQKDMNIFQIGVSSGYTILNSNAFKTNLFGQAGLLVGNFSRSKTPIALSFGIGNDFHLSIHEKIWKPFMRIGYQVLTNSIKNLDQNGLKIEIGFII